MPEKIILQTKPSVIPTLLYPISGSIVICPLVGFALWAKMELLNYIYCVVIALIIFSIAIKMVIEIVNIEFTILTLTETKLTFKRGIFDRDGSTYPLQAVQTTHTQKALLGQILDYGNLIITTAGSSVKIRNIPCPQQWENEILARLKH